MTSANEKLRRLMDERGVEWKAPASYDGSTKYDTIVDGYWFHEYDGRITVHGLTPEQAIAATLGSSNCTNGCTNSERTRTCCVIATKKLGDLFGYRLSCGHSMVNPFDDHPDYCPWCGAKVVVPTTNGVDAEVGDD